MANLETNSINALNGVVLSNALENFGTTGIIISGTWVGTITFQGSLDGSTFVDMFALDALTNSFVTSTTINGQFLINVAGLKAVQVKMTAYTSGTANVVLQANAAVSIQRTLSTVVGATDNTQIGNASDRLKVDAIVSETTNIAFPEAGKDSFGRLRVSSPETIFDSTFRWDKQPVTWSELVASGGSVAHNANKASVVLSCTTTTNSAATFQSRQYMRYHPGKSQLILVTGSFIEAATNVTKRFGYFDSNNGIFFQLSGSTLSVVRRSSTSGSVVDDVITQANWNIDKMDGTGASGITIDITKQQIFVMDFQWLGSGRIRYGFHIDGTIIYCHESKNANILTLPWSQTGDAPIRAEIVNTGSTASSLHITCAAVVCENFWSPKGVLRSISNSTTARSFSSAGTTIPIISLRKQSSYVNVPVHIVDFEAFANSADDFLISVIYNGSLTGASWSNVSGVCQQDISATAISGGTILYSKYLRGSSTSGSSVLGDVFHKAVTSALGRDVAGNSDILSVVATNITASASIYGVINYKELL